MALQDNLAARDPIDTTLRDLVLAAFAFLGGLGGVTNRAASLVAILLGLVVLANDVTEHLGLLPIQSVIRLLRLSITSNLISAVVVVASNMTDTSIAAQLLRVERALVRVALAVSILQLGTHLSRAALMENGLQDGFEWLPLLHDRVVHLLLAEAETVGTLHPLLVDRELFPEAIVGIQVTFLHR